MATLAEMNSRSGTRVWDRYTLKTTYAVGRYGRAGTHVHLIIVETVIAESGEHRPGTYRVGDVFRTAPICNGNRGQHGGQPFSDPRWNLTDITCKKCLGF